MSEWRGGRRRSSRTRVRLPHLPDEIIIKIADKLSLIDVGNLMSSCRVLASRAKYFYEQRRAVNMTCFKTVTPEICNRLITRFSRSCLVKLHFCYDIHRPHKYDDETLEAIFANFSFPKSRKIELYVGMPRMLDILAHGYFLNKFLSSQQHLKCLEVDKERAYVRGGGTLEIVRRNCPELEYYSSGCMKFHQNNVLIAFLQSCPRLKFANFCFTVGNEELDMYATLPNALELREAAFYLDELDICETRLRILGSRLHKIETVFVSIHSEEYLKDCIELVNTMPPLRLLCLTRFNRGLATDPVFLGVFSLLSELHHAPTCLVLKDVPEEELEMIVEVNVLDMLPKEIEHLMIFIRWCSRRLDKAIEALLDKFMDAAALRLKSCTVAVISCHSRDRRPPYLKTVGYWKIVTEDKYGFGSC